MSSDTLPAARSRHSVAVMLSSPHPPVSRYAPLPRGVPGSLIARERYTASWSLSRSVARGTRVAMRARPERLYAVAGCGRGTELVRVRPRPCADVGLYEVKSIPSVSQRLRARLDAAHHGSLVRGSMLSA
jgi:hypothetical protein